MKPIYILLDYKNQFYSSQTAEPYRSGMNKNVISASFRDFGYEVSYLRFADVNFREMDFKNKTVLYQSSEDADLNYKSFIEDIVLGLKLQGAILIPSFYLFRAHHNKVFMEILRDIGTLEDIKNIRSKYFGTLEEFQRHVAGNDSPIVIKPAEGSMSRGVSLAKTGSGKLRKARAVSGTKKLSRDVWDSLRALRRRGYIKESRHRKKFIAQDYVPNLGHDWKVVIYGKKFYVLMRQTRRRDFRASGSGRFEYKEDVPIGLLEFSKTVFDHFEVPYLSIDVGFDGNKYFLFEFQAIHFGNTAIQSAPCYFTKDGYEWKIKRERSNLEEEFVKSVVDYLERGPTPGNIT